MGGLVVTGKREAVELGKRCCEGCGAAGGG